VKREVTLGRVAVLIVFTIAVVGSMAQAPANASAPPDWLKDQLTFSNIVSLALLIYHFGFLKSQMETDRARLAKLETFNDEKLPETYVRQDVHETMMRGMDEKLDAVLDFIKGLGGKTGVHTHFRSKESE
jgi:hypothetical protein